MCYSRKLDESKAPSTTDDNAELRPLTEESLLDDSLISYICRLEAEAFDPASAASRESIVKRIMDSPYCKAVYKPGSKQCMGFILSSGYRGTRLDQQSMDCHDDDGESLCIHSLVIDRAYRGQGFGRSVLLAYVEEYRQAVLEGSLPLKRILLICRERLIPFYESVGFHNLGQSSVVMGDKPWFLQELLLA